ncbi:MAG: RND family transporter [Deltaproteobacteria bacterium]|nr:RND family transporter [Deltaproteobacteria bacterium]MBW2696432.1 RND family transporter [Deltaproteobacteria bacterium]
MVKLLEDFVFRHRIPILMLLGGVTLVMGYYATHLRMDAGFAKQLPRNHEYIKTFFDYQDQLFGSNRVIIVLRAKRGDIWNQKFLAKLQTLTDDVFFLPGVDRRTVTSIWTPNTRYFEITEEGMMADDVVPSSVLPDDMDEDDIALIRNNVVRGGFVGLLVANDYEAAMVTAELMDVDPRTEVKLDYLELAARLETEIRAKHVDEDFDVHILGFVTLMGQIADGARSVVVFFALAFLLTAGAVYYYSRSWILTFLPLICSLISVVWQFGVIYLLGFGLDPLAILVPFLVFAIGVSHGVQQINLISKQVCSGADSMTAARRSFSGLLVPGSMALITDLIGFGTLIIIPIAMIQELGITAMIGVAFKIITNLVLLPILASFFSFDEGYIARETAAREGREQLIRGLAVIAEPRIAVRVTIFYMVLFGVAVWQSQGRHVGDLQPGAPELRGDSDYNIDAALITDKFSLGLDVLTIIIETPAESCIDYETMHYLDEFGWAIANVPGVLSVASVPVIAKQVNAGWTEGNLKWHAMPRNRYALVRAVGMIPEETGLINEECTLMPVYAFTADHKAETIKDIIAAVENFRDTRPMEGVSILLASGNVGVQAAVNQELERSEVPMMVYVYLAIIALVIVTYRDWRATICCCVPLTLATFLGYWFMKDLEIGLKVATMPVMVLAVGVGVDYAFYIYNRLQFHLAEGLDITISFQQTLFETGTAVIFTAITLAIGVWTWSFSDLKFQADMGLLLTFMFIVNMIMAVTMLPALAVVIDMLIPRRKTVPPRREEQC